MMRFLPLLAFVPAVLAAWVLGVLNSDMTEDQCFAAL
jgi:hypothetical protein